MKINALRMLLGTTLLTLLLAAQPIGIGRGATAAQPKAKAPTSVRLYVFDCGVLHNSDMGRFSLKKEEVDTTDMSIACFLIAHPKGSLVWDVGAIPDQEWTPTGKTVTVRVSLPDGQQREADVDKRLLPQLAEIGYAPADITYLAFSHYHYDHTANANAFAGATWLVPELEHETMFGGGKVSGSFRPSTFSALEKSKKVILKDDEYDVFHDGSVIIKAAHGHTQGHQVLYVKLAKTGGVLLSGDLYHYPAEKTLDRVPTFDFSQEQTRASRAAVDAFLKKTGAQLWIQHDMIANSKLKKSPQFYD